MLPNVLSPDRTMGRPELSVTIQSLLHHSCVFYVRLTVVVRPELIRSVWCQLLIRYCEVRTCLPWASYFAITSMTPMWLYPRVAARKGT